MADRAVQTTLLDDRPACQSLYPRFLYKQEFLGLGFTPTQVSPSLCLSLVYLFSWFLAEGQPRPHSSHLHVTSELKVLRVYVCLWFTCTFDRQGSPDHTPGRWTSSQSLYPRFPYNQDFLGLGFTWTQGSPSICLSLVYLYSWVFTEGQRRPHSLMIDLHVNLYNQDFLGLGFFTPGSPSLRLSLVYLYSWPTGQFRPHSSQLHVNLYNQDFHGLGFTLTQGSPILWLSLVYLYSWPTGQSRPHSRMIDLHVDLYNQDFLGLGFTSTQGSPSLRLSLVYLYSWPTGQSRPHSRTIDLQSISIP